MEMLKQLQMRYGRYVEEAAAVAEKAPAMAGFLGFGSDPRNDPCHVRFYEDVGQWVQDFCAAGSDADGAYRAVHWMLTAAAAHRDEPSYGFLYAAQGHCKELIGCLSREHCAELMKLYDALYPRRNRMPVQQEIYKLLRKGAGKKW